ncbi:protein of unknown function [Pseudomonas sp. JV241A]|nr:protein of unknown function [Pseudomonas sp. JV241A]
MKMLGLVMKIYSAALILFSSGLNRAN